MVAKLQKNFQFSEVMGTSNNLFCHCGCGS